MKFTSYWLDTAPQGSLERSETTVAGRTDVAVIGGGLTGVVAALHLARRGAKVHLFEQHTVGFGASGRNGGMATTGMSIGIRDAVAKLGFETAARLYGAYTEAIDLIEKLVTEEGIDCDFARTGKLNLATKPAHFQGFAEDRRAVEQPPGRGLAAGPEGGAASRDRNRCVPRRNGRVEERRSPRGQVHPGTRRGRRARRRHDPRAGAGTEPDQGRLRSRARDPSRPDPGGSGSPGDRCVHPPAVPLASGPHRSGRQLHHRHRAARRKRVRRPAAQAGGWPRTPRTC